MSLTLRWRAATTLPVDGSSLRPDSFTGLVAAEASRGPIRVGNRTAELGELFEVEGLNGDDRLVIEGDLRHVQSVGRGMTGGSLMLRGSAGPRLGAEMAGGTIEVDGSVGDWAGAEMRGGLIKIRGDAGHFLGAAYPGSRLGMREGVILVEGTVGDDAGLQMRRGLIAVRGDAGEGLGRSMIAGTIIVLGGPGRLLGAGMKRGTLVVPHPAQAPESLVLPTFAPTGRFRSPVLTIYFRQLAEWGFPIPETVSSAPMDRYNGDLVVGGRGEILFGLHAA